MTDWSQTTGTERVIRDHSEVDDLLSALNDTACRQILSETKQEALSAAELSERCEIPQSTVYRKLQVLVDVGLLSEQVRFTTCPKNTHEYSLAVESVAVDIAGDTSISLVLTDRSGSAGDQRQQQLSAD